MLVITYHAIADRNSPVTVTRARFIAHLDALSSAGFRFLTLAELGRSLRAGKTPPRDGVALTFDDGYASVASIAWPVLEARRIPASVFVIAGRVGQDNRWPGQAAWVETMPLADAAALRELASAGADIGGHSWSHPRLTTVSVDALAEETVVAADRLEQLVSQRVRHFTYPYGRYGSREIAAVSGRFDLALTASCRRVTRGTEVCEIGRLDAHDLHLAARWRLLDSTSLDTYLAARRGARRLIAPLR